MRRAHEAEVVSLLRRHGALTRSQLGELIGLSRTSLSDITGTLLSNGVVMAERSEAQGVRGRPAEVLRLDPGAGQIVGVDFHHRRVRVVVVNAAHRVIGSAARPYELGRPWADRLDLALGLLAEMVSDGRVTLGGLERIGVGITGPQPIADGTETGERPSGLAVEVSRAFGERYGVPVLVENNTRLTALGEAAQGAGAAAGNMVYVQLSFGVGGGLVLGGRLVRGSAGTAGEVGHVPVALDGPACRCGGRGCLEQYASLPPVMRRAGYRDTGPESVEEFLTAATDPSAPRHQDSADAVRSVARPLGHVLSGLCNVLSPELVVIGGEMARVGRLLTEAVHEELQTKVLRPVMKQLRLRTAQLGDEGGALGAVALALHETPLLTGYSPTAG
ncbi:ROK family protein [Streptacidiphilus griseoplanus]|uniref:ROK family protein n=1 Tax=Peterkaempfera griseoplana TaxID=66896 RepID=UPI000A5B4DDC|nr:ROK family protein [Peterkaempfera griseoplana]